MTVALLLGAVFGLSGAVAYRALVPPPPPLQHTFDRLHRRPDLIQISESGGDDDAGVLTRSLAPVARRLTQSLGLRMSSLEPDLLLVGRTLEQHMTQKVLLGLFGLALPTLTSLVMIAGGVELPIALPLLASVAFAVVFFFVPDLTLRSEAQEQRRTFRHALGSFLDLVVIGLAGGAGVESALRDAAGIGQGWAFAQLRRALDVTAYTGETPWAALARLGDELGVTQLGELAASVSLAGAEGARVRDSLAAKAESLRDHALSAAEADAQSSTERMALPVVLLFVGFLVLIGYPAVDLVLTGI